MSNNSTSKRQRVLISSIGKVITGRTPPTKNTELYGDACPFITPSDIPTFDTRYLFRTERRISSIAVEDMEKIIVPENSIVYTCIASIGKIAVTKESSLTNQQINSIVVDPEKADYRYLYYLLRNLTPRIQAYAGGAATPIINKSTFESIEIELPEMAEQEAVGAFLATFDDLIENNTKRIKILEETARLIYREWFVHYRFPGHEKVKMVDSGTEVGEVPEGWKTQTFGNIAKSVRRNIPKGEIENGAAYVGFEHLPRKSITLLEWEVLHELGSNKLGFLKNEILFGKIRPYFHKVVFAPTDGICSADIIVIKAVETEYFPIALLCASSNEFVNNATTTSKGTKMPRADWDVIAKFPIALPDDKKILSMFNAIVEPILDLLQNMSIQNQKLKISRDFLLPQLISGQLAVL